jgi:predicted ATPase
MPAVRLLDQLDLHPKVTFFVGENGSGKSTLLEALAVSLGFNAEGGSNNFNFGTRHSHSELHEYLRVSKGFKRPRTGYFLRAESYFNLAIEIEKLDVEPGFGAPLISFYGNQSLHEQSHGESFMALLTHRFSGHGLYLLDEPEAALSSQKQLVALSRLHDLVKDDSQFIIATHSPILLAYPNAKIYLFDASGITETRYEDTEHFTLTKDFLNHHQQRMRRLLED